MPSTADHHRRAWGVNRLPGRRLLRLLSEHGANETGVVLDLGCGDSPYRSHFQRCANYLRVDRYPADAGVIAADVSALPLADGSVDLVLCSQVLGDVPDLVHGLSELARVLRPGGKLLVYETMAYPEHDAPHDFWRVMPAGLRWAAEKAGLRVESLEYLGSLFARASVLCNTYFFWRIARLKPLTPVAKAVTATSNLVLSGLDDLVGPSHLAPDYFACLVKEASRAS